MDLAYDPHAERARRKASSTSLNRLTLAPLTTKLPLNHDDQALVDSQAAFTTMSRRTSYIQGKSAPTTPRLLSRSPATPRSRSQQRTPSEPSMAFSKSKSTTHLGSAQGRRSSRGHGSATPRRRRGGHEDNGFGTDGRTDSDWLLRTGALMTSESREFKGQSWLVSRQSSTSLQGAQDDDDDAFDQELAMERSNHHLGSRRPSVGILEDDASPYGSHFHSRHGSRSHSIVDFRDSYITPLEHVEGDSYFAARGGVDMVEPDFVNLDEKLEELEQDTVQDDEAAVRRLVRHGQSGTGSWISNMLGWSLFSVEENDEDSEDEEDDYGSLEDLSPAPGRSGWSARHFEGISNVPEEKIPPPVTDQGPWQDAAWLLSVATKVMF